MEISITHSSQGICQFTKSTNTGWKCEKPEGEFVNVATEEGVQAKLQGIRWVELGQGVKEGWVHTEGGWMGIKQQHSPL